MQRANRRHLLCWSALAAAVLCAGLLSYATRPVGPGDAVRAPRLHAVQAGDPAKLDRTLRAAGLLDAVKSGSLHAVSRVGLSRIPPAWDSIDDANWRKSLFVASILPLVLAANEVIVDDRARLLALHEKKPALSAAERAWLQGLARRYRTEPEDWARLLARVDAVPPSLAVAQAAIESGWGTSRFARQGNALFGQWTWQPGAGLKPKQMRAELGDYAIKRYPSLYGSVADYMRNLNTQKAYAGFRRLRAGQRANGKQPSGRAVASTLTSYSEEGAKYVSKLLNLIKSNSLGRLDQARLTR